MKRIALILGIVLLCAATPPHHGAYGFTYGPYDGMEGYQEIQVSRDIYFVAFHGEKQASGDDVNEAWRTRAAELCLKSGAEQFMELKYSFEPVMRKDPPLLLSHSEGYGASIMKAHMIFIPIFIPSVRSIPRTPSVYYYSAPSQQAHIRCLRAGELSQVAESRRLVETAKILADAKSRGWITTPPARQTGNKPADSK